MITIEYSVSSFLLWRYQLSLHGKVFGDILTYFSQPPKLDLNRLYYLALDWDLGQKSVWKLELNKFRATFKMIARLSIFWVIMHASPGQQAYQSTLKTR